MKNAKRFFLKKFIKKKLKERKIIPLRKDTIRWRIDCNKKKKPLGRTQSNGHLIVSFLRGINMLGSSFDPCVTKKGGSRL
jgi:hypothetical protein